VGRGVFNFVAKIFVSLGDTLHTSAFGPVALDRLSLAWGTPAPPAGTTKGARRLRGPETRGARAETTRRRCQTSGCPAPRLCLILQAVNPNANKPPPAQFRPHETDFCDQCVTSSTLPTVPRHIKHPSRCGLFSLFFVLTEPPPGKSTNLAPNHPCPTRISFHSHPPPITPNTIQQTIPVTGPPPAIEAPPNLGMSFIFTSFAPALVGIKTPGFSRRVL